MNGEQKSPWPLVLVLLATALAYLRALGGELVYDDLQMIERNPLIRDLGNVPRMFGQGYWDFLGEANASYNGYWRPLTAISLALAYAVGGGSTEVFHAACLLVHLAATGLAYALALRLSRERAVAFFTALLFGLHPVHVESVAWITALNDPLFGLFGLAALFAFAGWRERGSPGLPLAAALWFAVALLAKELAVAVLPMLVALDLFRRRAEGEPAGLLGGLRAPARTYGTLGAVLLAYYLARVAVFGSPAAGLDRITTYFGVGFGRLALLRVELLGGGLGLLAWPVDLNVFRPFHPVLAATSPVVIGAALALAAFVALAAWEWRRGGRLELLALLVMPAGILPILLRVASLGRFPLSDRFLYLPVVGFALYATLVARRLLPPRTAGAALTLVAGLYAWGTYARIGVWANEEALFRSAVTADPRSAYAHWGLGRVLLDHYNETEDDAALAEAFVVYQRAQALVEEVLSDPESDLFISSADVLQINLGFGWCLVAEAVNDEYHDFDTPAALFEQLLTRIYEIRENAEEARKQGLQVLVEPLEVEQVHVALGVTHMLARRYTKAETSFRQALAENESYPEAHSNFGRLLADLGEFDRARHHFERALELRPDGYEDRLMLARALFERGWYERA
ncbi:MAG: tetratricopeptide repeat protein [Planctomycetota bacterium]